MRHIQVLDCTLRDGGYCNDFNYGLENIKRITAGLVEANIDIIECGFLTDAIIYDESKTRFSSLTQADQVIPKDKKGKTFVLLADYGKFDPQDLPNQNDTLVDGLRIAFHKENWQKCLKICQKVKEKGYKVFVQPMVSIRYSDLEFLELIQAVNKLNPYAFYIVDSFGMMKRKELIRLYYMVEHNMKESIHIGFHSHNNMQLSYSNAQTLVDLQSSRDLIIDSSIYGMGRGAGNLNTELFVQYLNDNTNGDYRIKPLLTIIDQIINRFFETNHWGYSLPNYLSALHNTHPNYALYLNEKNTLTIEAMDEIFCMIDEEKKYVFDKEYIENVYLKYMSAGNSIDQRNEELRRSLMGKKVLLIAPGKSSRVEAQTIKDFIKIQRVIVISVNFDYLEAETDYIFLSNLRRFRELDIQKHRKCIITSNISADDVFSQTGYTELLNDEEVVKDNAGLMAVKFLINNGVKEVFLAGYDGYAHDMSENYADNQMTMFTKNAILDAMNESMSKILNLYKEEISIHFLTHPKSVKLIIEQS